MHAAPKSRELQAVQSRMAQVQAQLNQDRQQRTELDAQIEAVEARLQSASDALKQLQAELDVQQANIDRLQAKQSVFKRRLTLERKALSAQLRTAYMLGRHEQIKMLLSQNSTAGASRLLSYYDYYSRARSQKVKQVLADIATAQTEELQLHAEWEKLSLNREKQMQLLTQEATARNARLLVLQQLRQRIHADVAEVQRLRSSEARLLRLIQATQVALADTPVQPQKPKPAAIPAPVSEAPAASAPAPIRSDGSFKSRRGQLPWPVQGPLLARFGQDKAGGKLIWRGHWIGAERNNDVRSTAAGRVAYVGTMQAYGNIVIVEHPGGYFTLYGHLESARTAIGEMVSAGTVIGAAGDSGGHEQTGVYFEVRRGTNPENPRDWLAR